MASYNENGVPILEVSPATKEYVDGVQAAAIAAIEDPEVDASPHYLVGENVVVHCPAHKNHEQPEGREYVHFRIGGSTLDEACKEVIQCFDTAHVLGGDHTNPPDWVASSNEDLARVLSEHYGCEVRDIYEVLN